MTNIWAQPFEELRKPFFEMEDPYTLREKREKEEKEEKPKRWWDDDGDGIGYEKGEVSGKFKKKKVKEEVEEIDEAITSEKGKAKAAEMIAKRSTASGRAKPGQGGSVAQIKHISRSSREGLSGTPATRSTSGKNYPKSYTGSGGTGNKAARRAGLTPTREKPNAWKEEVETLTEVDKTRENERKLDVRKGIKNKIDIAPKLREDIEEWIGEVIEEGYDLSNFTLDEVINIYETAELDEATAGMPAQGDAQRVDATDDRMLSAKRRAAQAQIRADLARVQLQKASVTKESFDSIVSYLLQRPDAFENLEEGVYDPKKSKLRPASERSKTEITDAQRKAAKKEAQRTAEIHSKGETVLAGLRSSGTKGKVKTTPDAKPAAPEANRKVKGRYDKLAKAASKVLKDIKK